MAGLSVSLADTAGIRHSNDDVENIGVDRALARVRSSDIVALLLDPDMIHSRLLPHPLIHALLDCSSSPFKRVIGVLAKSDTIGASDLPQLEKQLEDLLLEFLPSSLLHGVCRAHSLGPDGVADVQSLILAASVASSASKLESNGFSSENPAFFARNRQLHLLQLVSQHLLLFCDENLPFDIR
jgi:tRNA U34 5-carboxymethylaminomethyl modifying GTPase MnmE/TrmE